LLIILGKLLVSSMGLRRCVYFRVVDENLNEILSFSVLNPFINKLLELIASLF